ncbi:MAG: radical SAM protein [candidate division WOR-3 bacterium]|nr:MAG: radical SAM protein [candidate division WOR-3 bacterium]
MPSRRLGFSLGIDIIPLKNCSYDCVYCQLGKTKNKVLLRKEYTPAQDVLADIEKALKNYMHIDFLTFSGSGEPTLHKKIGYLIREIKKLTTIPVAVLTNGSLLHLPEVRDDLMNADVVIPTLCTADEDVFRVIHRGHNTVDIRNIINGYIDFRKDFKGQIWLEVMIVRGVNDKPEQIKRLKKVIEQIKPDRIHLNTVVRPPSESSAHPVSHEKLQELKDILGSKTEIVVDFSETAKEIQNEDTLEMILAIISRRPITADDLAKTTNLPKKEILECIKKLSQKGKVMISEHEGRKFYTIRGIDDRTKGPQQG